MTQPVTWAGIHTALVTPFADDGSVDLAVFEALCARQIDAGIHGLVACGTTGEASTLEPDEWQAVVSAAVRVSGGRVPVSAGVGTNNTRSTVHNVAAAAEAGADCGLLVFPYYSKPNAAGLRTHVQQAAAVGLPLMLYHVPSRTGQRLEPGFLAELMAIDGVVGIKEATGDLRFGTDLVALTERAVLSGDDFSFLGLLAQGGVGCVSVVSNVAPARTVAVYERQRAGDTIGALASFRQIWALSGFLFSDASPAPCKAAMAALGLCTSHVRLPLAPYAGQVPIEVVRRALE